MGAAAFPVWLILKLLLFFGLAVQLVLVSFRFPIFSETDSFSSFFAPREKKTRVFIA